MTVHPLQQLRRGKSIFRRLVGKPAREFYLYLPTTLQENATIIVAVHGISMNAAEHMVKLRQLAEDKGAVIIAPYFSKRRYPRYQQLEDPKTGKRADLALIEIVESVCTQFGLKRQKFTLIGYSGGAQFAHRFAFYHADRVMACISCAAGWYTYPNFQETYPLGLSPNTGPAGMSVHPDWRNVRHHVIVGSIDTAIEPSLNMKPEIVAQQGTGRLERAQRWVEAMNNVVITEVGLPVEYSEIAGMGHDFTDAYDNFRVDRIISQSTVFNK